MISSELRLQLQSEIKNLPGYRQVLLQQFDWIGELEKIAVKFGLNAAQEKVLVVETALVLFSAVDPELYPQELIKQASLTPEVVEKITKDVIERVMNRVQSELDEMMKTSGHEIVDQMRRELGDSEILASTGLQLVSDESVMTSVPENEVVNPNQVNLPPATPGHDPYHEPVE